MVWCSQFLCLGSFLPVKHRNMLGFWIPVPCSEDMRPRLRLNTGDGITWEKKRKTGAETDGLCQPRHESYRDNRK